MLLTVCIRTPLHYKNWQVSFLFPFYFCSGILFTSILLINENERAHEVLVLIVLATNKDSDETTNMCSLPRAFTFCIQKVEVNDGR